MRNQSIDHERKDLGPEVDPTLNGLTAMRIDPT